MTGDALPERLEARGERLFVPGDDMECATIHDPRRTRGEGAPLAAELVRRWSAHAELVAALETAANLFDKIAAKATCGCYEECACTLYGCWSAEDGAAEARAALAKAGRP